MIVLDELRGQCERVERLGVKPLHEEAPMVAPHGQLDEQQTANRERNDPWALRRFHGDRHYRLSPKVAMTSVVPTIGPVDAVRSNTRPIRSSPPTIGYNASRCCLNST